MRILLLSLGLGLGLWSPSGALAQESGSWRISSGEVVTRPCLDVSEYGETTPVPFGCPVLLEGGGILYTRSADSLTTRDILTLRAQIQKQKSAIISLRSLLKDTTDRHDKIVVDLSKQCDRCADALERAPRRATIWIALGAGIATGAAIMATIFVVN